MSQKQIDALHAAAAAAREGMGLEDEQPKAEGSPQGEQPETEAPEMDSPEAEPEAPTQEEGDDEPAEEEEPANDDDAPEGDAPGEEGEPQDHTSVYGQLNQIRSQKREADAKLREITQALGSASVEDALAAIETMKKNQPVPEAFDKFAKENGIEDPKVLKGLFDIFSAENKREMQEALKPFQDELGTFKSTIEAQQSQGAWNESMTHMDNEWKEVMPFIQDTWKPDPAKAQEAHDLMAELAHSERYHDKELDYILFKERSQFEAIFGAPKKKTMFPSRGAPRSVEQKRPAGSLPKSDGSHESIMQAQKALASIKNGGGFTESDSLD